MRKFYKDDVKQVSLTDREVKAQILLNQILTHVWRNKQTYIDKINEARTNPEVDNTLLKTPEELFEVFEEEVAAGRIKPVDFYMYDFPEFVDQEKEKD